MLFIDELMGMERIGGEILRRVIINLEHTHEMPSPRFKTFAESVNKTT
jgi:hypothetical protein